MLIGHWAYQLPRQASPLPGRLGGPPEPFVGALQKGGHHPLPLEKCCAAAASPAEENRFSFMFRLLFDALDKLEERERHIITLRFGLDGKPERTQKEVADKIGISQSYISRLEKRIIARLKKEILRMM